jgi:pyruvate carboxylase
VGSYPDLGPRTNRAEKLLTYFAEIAVNGHPPEMGATGVYRTVLVSLQACFVSLSLSSPCVVCVVCVAVCVRCVHQGAPPATGDAVAPALPLPRTDPSKPFPKPFPKPSLKAIFDKEGPKAFAKTVRQHQCVLDLTLT